MGASYGNIGLKRGCAFGGGFSLFLGALSGRLSWGWSVS